MSEDPLNKDTALRAALDQHSRSFVLPLGIAITSVYILLTFMHLFYLSSDIAGTMAASAVLSFILVGALTFTWHSGRITRNPHLIITLFTLVALGNSLLHLSLEPLTINMGNLALITIAMGLIYLDRRWYYPLLLLVAASWIASGTQGSFSSQRWLWFLVFSSAVSLVMFEQRVRSTAALITGELRLRQSAAVLRRLTTAPELVGGHYKEMMALICETASDTLHVDRTGIWLLEQDGNELLSLDVYDVSTGEHETGARLERDQFRPYFTALESASAMAASDALTDPRTICLTDYLTANGIVAMLDASILVDGQLRGVLCHEQRSRRQWTAHDETMAASLAEIVSLTLSASDRATLEKRVSESQRLESMGILAGGVAHDFNNLLVAIVGYTELLQMKFDNDSSVSAQLEQIRKATRQASDLSQKMLTYSGRGTFVTRPSDLISLTNETVSGWRTLEGFGGILETTGSDELLAEVDPTQFRQVLTNLLHNAVEAGADTISITSAVRTLDQEALSRAAIREGLTPGHYACVCVEDNGEGMTPEMLARMFEPFFTGKTSGRGLGLASVLGIMRGHHGTIAVESTPGSGTTIRTYYPLADLSDADIREEPEPQPMTDQLDILLVEDQEVVRNSVTLMLSSLGHDVVAFDSLATLREGLGSVSYPSMALIDLTLGDGDGIEALSLIRSKVADDLPVILMSGYDATDAMTRLSNQQSVDFLKKPFTLKDLNTAIAQLCSTQ